MKIRHGASLWIVLLLALGASQACSRFEDYAGDQTGNNDQVDGDIEEEDPFTEREQSAEVWPALPANLVADAGKEPMNIHMTWQHDPSTSISLQWTFSDIDIENYEPKIWVVPADAVEDEGEGIAMPYASQYVESGSCEFYQEEFSYKGQHKAGDEQFVTCTVEMGLLQPSTLYYYRVGSWSSFDEEGATFSDDLTLSDILTFKTGLPSGNHEPFMFVSAGDSRGGYSGIKQNIERLAALDADFWLFNGDMNDNGTQEQWNQWFDAMKPLMDTTVLMPVQGNHEFFATVFYRQFAVPQVAQLDDDMKEYGWSFDYGCAHFVGLNSNTSSIVEGLVPWLRSDLQAAKDNPDIKWIIVMFHHPIYSASNHGSTERLQDAWIPVFDEFNVDLTFAGHDHNYERTKLMRGGVPVEQGGTVHVVAGGFFSPGYSNGQAEWTEVSYHGDIGNYVTVDVSWDALDVTAFSGDGSQILDEFTLSK